MIFWKINGWSFFQFIIPVSECLISVGHPMVFVRNFESPEKSLADKFPKVPPYPTATNNLTAGVSTVFIFITFRTVRFYYLKEFEFSNGLHHKPLSDFIKIACTQKQGLYNISSREIYFLQARRKAINLKKRCKTLKYYFRNILAFLGSFENVEVFFLILEGCCNSFYRCFILKFGIHSYFVVTYKLICSIKIHQKCCFEMYRCMHTKNKFFPTSHLQ